jgi:hypothetical protein
MRHRVELSTTALITVWLLDLLERRRPDLHMRDPYRSGIAQFERRPRRLGEWPDDRSFDALMRQARDDHDGGSATTPGQEGGTRRVTDDSATQS